MSSQTTTSIPGAQACIMSRYESILSTMQQRARDEGRSSDDFAAAFDCFYELALVHYPNSTPGEINFLSEKTLWNHLWPREQFPGQFVQFRPPPPPTNVGSARPKIFEHKTRQIITNPLLGSGLRPLYGLDEQGFPFWCFLLPLSELELFKGYKDSNIKNMEETFGILVCIHEIENYFLVYPEHPEEVPQDGLIAAQSNMDRFYKYVYLLDREARGMNGFLHGNENARERTFPEDYLTKFLEQEKNGLLNWHMPQPPRPPRHNELLASQWHAQNLQQYRSQFRKPKTTPTYAAKAAFSSSWLVQNYDNGLTGASIVDNENAEKETNLGNNEMAAAGDFYTLVGAGAMTPGNNGGFMADGGNLQNAD